MSKSGDGRALLIATAGGHLTQLSNLVQRLDIDPANAVWVTVPTTQSRSMLAGHDVVWATYSSPRDFRGLGRHLTKALDVLRCQDFDIAVSTGASLAPPFLAAARLRGVPSHYIESATRVDGPSFSGRLVARIPGVKLYSQYESWADGRWAYGGSIFDGWATTPRPEPRPLRRALVTVGSARGFPFDRMLLAARDALPTDCETTWQVLDSSVRELPGRVVHEFKSAELRSELETVDVVISHAGTGSALTALQLGLCPVLVPRSQAHGEHVDDHQFQIARMLGDRALAVVRAPEELTTADLVQAAGRIATEVPGPSFRLSA
ncbi:glycosyltransferase [uncultured Jatrophihabitans sp.]|uniref:glycosyltransferase n=1 Tax=uncultured Jatrophihabitans sp. TaxID=1610747 RepID=UPI0035C9E2A9